MRKKKKRKISQVTKPRWLPNDNTRAQTFINRKAQANKLACRKKED